ERDDRDLDTFVVTEDDYIDYLAGESVRALIPAYLMRRIRESDLLFLGYSMRHWNLRVILRQIWSEQGISTAGWAHQRGPSEIDERSWARQGIELLDVPLGEWVHAMRGHLGAPRPRWGQAARPVRLGGRRIRAWCRTARPTRSGSSAGTSG